MTKMLTASGGLRPPDPWPGALPLAAYASEAEPPLLHITTLTTAKDDYQRDKLIPDNQLSADTSQSTIRSRDDYRQLSSLAKARCKKVFFYTVAKDIDAIFEFHTLRYVESILDNVLMLLQYCLIFFVAKVNKL